MTGNGWRAQPPFIRPYLTPDKMQRGGSKSKPRQVLLQGPDLDRGPMGGATWYPNHRPHIQPEPSTWGLRVLGLSVWSCFIWAAASALAGNKGDAVDVCIPEGEEQAAQTMAFTARRDHCRTKAAQVFLVQ